MPHATASPTRPLLAALAVTAAGVALAYVLVGLPPLVGAEDASIGFRYARNLAEGHGIVFNPGGERVEGFTSMLWLLVSAGAYALVGPASLETVLLAVSLVLTVLTVALVLRTVFEHVDGAAGHGVAILWLAAQGGFWFWSGLSLMDVAPWAAGLTLFLVLVQRRCEAQPVPRGLLPALVVCLALTRPESMLIVPGVLVVAALAYGTAQPVRRLLVEAGVTIAVSVAALTAFRISYFGAPLPNTYYAKVSPDVVYRLGEGLGYVLAYPRAHPLAWVAAAGIVAWVGVAARQRLRPAPTRASRLGVLTAGFILVGFASVVSGGGDHYQGHRFLQPYLPLAAIPLALGVEALQRRVTPRRTRGRTALSAAAIVLMAAPLYGEWTTFRDHGLRRQAFDVGLQGRFVAETLEEAFAGEPLPDLGLWMVGGAGYAWDGPVTDLLGLNWKAMGMSPGDRKGIRDHAAFNLDVFWSAPPELMLPEPQVVLGGMRCIRVVLGGALRGLLTTERFYDVFEPVRIRRGDTEPIIAYARADWLRTAPPVVERLGWGYCGVAR